MERKGFLISWLVTLAGSQIFDIVVHRVLLADAYASFAQLWRPEAELMSMFPLMIGISVVWTCIFVYMFGWARKGPGVAEGVRFGICVGLFTGCISLMSYAFLPVSLSIGIAWFGAEVAKGVLLGALVSVTYRPKSAA